MKIQLVDKVTANIKVIKNIASRLVHFNITFVATVDGTYRTRHIGRTSTHIIAELYTKSVIQIKITFTLIITFITFIGLDRYHTPDTRYYRPQLY